MPIIYLNSVWDSPQVNHVTVQKKVKLRTITLVPIKDVYKYSKVINSERMSQSQVYKSLKRAISKKKITRPFLQPPLTIVHGYD